MNIRSINAGFNIQRDGNEENVQRASRLISEVKKAFKASYPKVRTTRFCSQPLVEVGGLQPGEVGRLVREIDGACRASGIDWFCTPVGMCEGGQDYPFIDSLPEIMRNSKISFSNVVVTHGRRIDFEAINRCARQVKRISRTERHGFDNFRFCTSANVKPNGAFFPYSWHQGEDGFSLGLETIDLILKISSKSRGLAETRRVIMSELSKEFESIDETARGVEDRTGMKYYGLDLSLAPYPTEDQSIGKAIERLGVERFGANGTLFLTAYLTDMLKELERTLPIRTVGFTGAMFPLLEDRYLTESNDRGLLSMESMLLYSTVCGCGPDMIPLPGNV
ncbi:DUF711 family protein, partial [Candidatus Bathyarchaeota archaeon]|nr:DUF711 family protein [Candidatus Bathyarchaeota archaeon]